MRREVEEEGRGGHQKLGRQTLAPRSYKMLHVSMHCAHECHLSYLEEGDCDWCCCRMVGSEGLEEDGEAAARVELVLGGSKTRGGRKGR